MRVVREMMLALTGVLWATGAASAADASGGAAAPLPPSRLAALPLGEREPPAAKMEKGPYLGVATQPAGDTLDRQLKLPQGVGLVVVHVDPASPAGQVLKEHDVLHKLNDQILVDHRQLAVLVRMMRPGEKVSLARVRDGNAETVTVELGEKDLAPLSSDSWNNPPVRLEPPIMYPMGPEMGDHMLDELRKHLRDFGMGSNNVEGIMQRMQRSTHGMIGGGPVAPWAQIRMRMGDPDGENVTSAVSDDMTLTVTRDAAGKRDLSAIDASGKERFSGPINTEEEMRKVPPEVRRKLEDLEKTQKGLIQEGKKDPARKEGKIGDPMTM